MICCSSSYDCFCIFVIWSSSLCEWYCIFAIQISLFCDRLCLRFFFFLACLSLSGNRFIYFLIFSISFCISCCGLDIYTYQKKVFLYYTNFFIFLVFFVVVAFYLFIFYLFIYLFILFNCRRIMCTWRRDRNTVYI